MNAKTGENRTSKTATVVALGKDVISILRDGALFFIAILLLVFPEQFNTLLVNAGFEEGSVVGFTWKSKLIDSTDALEQAEITIADLQNKNDELLETITDLSSGSTDPQLKTRVSDLTNEVEQLKSATKTAQGTVKLAIESNAPLVEKALSSISHGAPYRNSDYLVGVQTTGFPDSERVDLNMKLNAQGYRLHNLSATYDARPNWFAYDPTILYYAASSSAAAKELANFLQKVTGQEFAVIRGSGLGVNPDERTVTLFVHYRKQ